jgi:hypothetical protein
MARLPNALEFRQGMQLFIGCDQRPATLERSGRDEAIGRIPVLKEGAVGENSDFRGDRQDPQAHGLQQP